MLTEISQIQEDKHHVFSLLPNVLNLSLAGGVGGKQQGSRSGSTGEQEAGHEEAGVEVRSNRETR